MPDITPGSHYPFSSPEKKPKWNEEKRIAKSSDTGTRADNQLQGVRVYGFVRGFFMNLIGRAIQVNINGQMRYVSRRSLEKFIERNRPIEWTKSAKMKEIALKNQFENIEMGIDKLLAGAKAGHNIHYALGHLIETRNPQQVQFFFDRLNERLAIELDPSKSLGSSEAAEVSKQFLNYLSQLIAKTDKSEAEKHIKENLSKSLNLFINQLNNRIIHYLQAEKINTSSLYSDINAILEILKDSQATHDKYEANYFSTVVLHSKNNDDLKNQIQDFKKAIVLNNSSSSKWRTLFNKPPKEMIIGDVLQTFSRPEETSNKEFFQQIFASASTPEDRVKLAQGVELMLNGSNEQLQEKFRRIAQRGYIEGNSREIARVKPYLAYEKERFKADKTNPPMMTFPVVLYAATKLGAGEKYDGKLWADPPIRGTVPKEILGIQVKNIGDPRVDPRVGRNSQTGVPLAKRRTFTNGGVLKLDADGLPVNPTGPTGRTGRGLLGLYGPNEAVDSWIYRIQRGIVEFLTITRTDTPEGEGHIACCGGMREGDGASAAAMKEVSEEIANIPQKDISRFIKALTEWDQVHGKEGILKTFLNNFRSQTPDKIQESLTSDSFKAAFKNEFLIPELSRKVKEFYKGKMKDPRETDMAWMETTGMIFDGISKEGMDVLNFCEAGDDASGKGFHNIMTLGTQMFASHTPMGAMALLRMERPRELFDPELIKKEEIEAEVYANFYLQQSQAVRLLLAS